jgi:hypothetical protein
MIGRHTFVPPTITFVIVVNNPESVALATGSSPLGDLIHLEANWGHRGFGIRESSRITP